MEHYDNDTDNNNPDKKTANKSKMYGRFITTIAFPTLLLLLTLISAAPTYPVQATGGSNETAATPAPGGASVGPAGGGGTNVTQSDCVSQNATTTNQSSGVNAGGANDTSITFAPGGASIGANDTSTLNATAGNTAANTSTTTNNTSITFAPGGASIGANDTSTLNATAGNTAANTSTTFAPSGASLC